MHRFKRPAPARRRISSRAVRSGTVALVCLVALGSCDLLLGLLGIMYENPRDDTTTGTQTALTQTIVRSGKPVAYISFTDQNGDPIDGLNRHNFLVQERSDDSEPWTDVPPGSLRLSTVDDSGQTIAVACTMDYSSSMKVADKTNMETAMHTFLGYLRQGDRGEIIKFSSGIGVVQPYTADHALLRAAVDSPFPGGNTALADAVGRGLEDTKDLAHEGSRAVIALTDGMENNSRTWTLRECREYSLDNSIPIIAIGFGNDSEATLERLATSGIYRYLPDSGALRDVYDQIARRLRKAYVLGWSGSGSPGETVLVKVSVEYAGKNGSWISFDEGEYTLPP